MASKPVQYQSGDYFSFRKDRGTIQNTKKQNAGNVERQTGVGFKIIKYYRADVN
jgi:hypothetical protein